MRWSANQKTKKSGNTYFVMRHGESKNNLTDEISSAFNNDDGLTEKGKEEVKKSAELLKNKKIDLIITSPFLRTKETAEILEFIDFTRKLNNIVED